MHSISEVEMDESTDRLDALDGRNLVFEQWQIF